MNSNTFNLISEKLFPFQFQLFGVVLLFGGIASFISYPYISPFLVLLAFSIFTGYRGIQFDQDSKLYRTYISFLFLKLGKWKEYDSIFPLWQDKIPAARDLLLQLLL